MATRLKLNQVRIIYRYFIVNNIPITTIKFHVTRSQFARDNIIFTALRQCWTVSNIIKMSIINHLFIIYHYISFIHYLSLHIVDSLSITIMDSLSINIYHLLIIYHISQKGLRSYFVAGILRIIGIRDQFAFVHFRS